MKPNTQSNKISIDDFDLIKVLGRGAFGKVTIKLYSRLCCVRGKSPKNYMR